MPSLTTSDFLNGFLHPSFDPMPLNTTPASSVEGSDDYDMDPSEWRSVMVAEWLRRKMLEKYGDACLPQQCFRALLQNLVDGTTVTMLTAQVCGWVLVGVGRCGYMWVGMVWCR